MTTLTDQAIAQIPASCQCGWIRTPSGTYVRVTPHPGCGWHTWETP